MLNLSYNDIVGCYFGAITVLYGVMLGLLVVDFWSNFSETTARVDRESQRSSGPISSKAPYSSKSPLMSFCPVSAA